MTIDLAWKSLAFEERIRVIEVVREDIIEHTNECPVCERNGTHCGAVQHLIDFVEALEDSV